MEIKSDRVHLRAIKDTDIDNVFKGLSHPEVIKYYGVSFDSKEATQEQMKWFSDLESKGTGKWWAVCANDDGRFLGAGGLNDLSKEHKKAEIGFWLLREHWGRGYMTEAMPLIFDYTYEVLGLHRIEGYVESKNSICKKAVEKLNFKYEGTMVDWEMKNGKYISLDIYAKFKE